MKQSTKHYDCHQRNVLRPGSSQLSLLIVPASHDIHYALNTISPTSQHSRLARMGKLAVRVHWELRLPEDRAALTTRAYGHYDTGASPTSVQVHQQCDSINMLSAYP
nr:hypothetical protein BgiMline_016923 [Biomphalaria glabrata]